MDYTSKKLNSFFDQLAALYEKMDRKYAKAANHYGFHCRGCEDNCCETLFHHHTFLEFFYLKSGFETLSGQARKDTLIRASEVVRKTSEVNKRGSLRIMCPLNVEGFCILYDYRPMICRLHGISSELKPPAQSPSVPERKFISDGCQAFFKQCGNKAYYPFDRTHFYFKMARLEKDLKEAFGFNKKIKMTVAEILITATDKI